MTHQLSGRIKYVLIMTVLVQFLYPFSDDGSAYVALAYQVFYMCLFASGIFLVKYNRPLQIVFIVATAIWMVVGPLYAFRPDLTWAIIVSYWIYLFFLTALIVILFRFIFEASTVNLDVLLAACTVYLLLGGVFVPIYGSIESISWFYYGEHAFIDGVHDLTDTVFPWQTLVYYSYATLTTLGYGDVLPVSQWARSAATLQATIGVLYTAVIVSRLVGLYAANEVEQELKQ